MRVILFQIGCVTLSELFSHIIREVPTISSFTRCKGIDIKIGPFLLLTVVSGTGREELLCETLTNICCQWRKIRHQATLSSEGKFYLLSCYSVHFPKQSYSRFFNAPTVLS